MKIVLFNGPARSGKDTATNAVVEAISGATAFKFSQVVKEGTHVALGLPAFHAGFEAQKDMPLPEFYGLTPRQAYIAHSEIYMKQVYGNDIFAKLAVQQFRSRVWSDDAPIVISDCGFQIEVDYITEAMHPKNVMLIKLQRRGFSFAGDSREYVKPHPEQRCLTIENNENEIVRFGNECVIAIQRWLKH